MGVVSRGIAGGGASGAGAAALAGAQDEGGAGPSAACEASEPNEAPDEASDEMPDKARAWAKDVRRDLASGWSTSPPGGDESEGEMRIIAPTSAGLIARLRTHEPRGLTRPPRRLASWLWVTAYAEEAPQRKTPKRNAQEKR
jgi:hypothetical protein